MKLIASLALLAASFATPVMAAPTADFRAELDLDWMGSGPLVFENLGVNLNAAPQLTGANEIANPSDWLGGVVDVSWNLSSGVLTLQSQDTLDFGSYHLLVSNIDFGTNVVVTGLSGLTDNLTDIGLTPVLSFGDDWFRISYLGTQENYFNFTGNKATFQVSLSETPAVGGVPEASTWAMMIMGFGLVGMTARRRQRVALPQKASC